MNQSGENVLHLTVCTDLTQQTSMNDVHLFILFSSFYEESGEPTEYFWQIDRKVQFGKS